MPEERVIRRQSLSSIAVGSFYELIVSCVQMGAKTKAATTGPIAVTCKTVQPKRQHPVTANDITGQKDKDRFVPIYVGTRSIAVRCSAQRSAAVEEAGNGKCSSCDFHIPYWVDHLPRQQNRPW